MPWFVHISYNARRSIVENPKLDAMHRKKYLTKTFLSFIEQVACSSECCLLIDNKLDILIKKVLDQFNASESTSRGPCAASVDVQVHVQVPNDDLLRNVCLKKKNVQTRTSLRPRT
jgi:hypothetical protein